jgi:hypothetical protein
LEPVFIGADWEPRGVPHGRRRETRIHVAFPVGLASSAEAVDILQADAVNLSLGGLCVRTSPGYRAGQRLAIDVRCEAGRFALRGVVAWSTPRAALLGIRFVDLPPEASARLEALILLLAALAQ